MINFDNLPLDPSSRILLSKIDIDFVFQPIFQLSTGKIIAYEALIEHTDCNEETIVDDYEVHTRIHALELATFFGATMRFLERNYGTKLCLNSFASETLTPREAEIFFDNIGKPLEGRLIVDLLDHNYYSPLTWNFKRTQLRSHNVSIVLDDFSPTYEHVNAFNVFEPDFVKLDRCYLEDICRNRDRQDKLNKVVAFYHHLGAKVMIEGIETSEEYEYIKTTDIDFVQGNYLGKPE